MKKMLIVVVAVLTLGGSSLYADTLTIQEQKIETCALNSKLVVTIKMWLAAGFTSEFILSQVESQDVWIKKVLLRNISWAMYYGNNSDEFLRVTYYKTCINASAGPLNMPGPEW